ncbi:uncharacterized protein LOC105436159 [Cucumis sativus]|uniref:Uncharacterized protein n=1 Tax=Cucumis sativus TaxID=3659 RepID=A0A0A0K5M6_CUCSA|nr:uncharacterized protein LOC105436159 [Cucumis sativus]XP_011659295.1 uncharacterized protein LOC105436159 [Cucumis sativus]KGN44798.1 hypothetical protein Csa_016449 [Cucumis sativus]
MLLEFGSAMETLVIIEQYRDEFCHRIKPLESGRFGNLTIKDHNRFRFRPTPLEISSIPVYCFSSPKTPPSCAPIPINEKNCVNESIDFDAHCCYKRLSFPELWAGPTYSNSPPASSLPIPKFSIRGNRTVSLELPTNSVEKIHPIVKSAPPSPTRGHTHPSSREPCHGADCATRTLRRILNLDVNSE